jgi:hypothetical protein
MLNSVYKVNPIAGLTPGWSDLCRLAEGNGIDYNALIAAIVESALSRCLPKAQGPSN